MIKEKLKVSHCTFPYVIWHENCRFFDNEREHYRLLSYLSWNLSKGTTVVDIGTYLGYSALCLSHNQNINVITYNLQEDIKADVVSAKLRNNIDFRIKNCLDDIDEIIKSPLIFLDTNHDGEFERQFIAALEKKNYTGLVFCDDIVLNDEMKSFWADITRPKLDITDMGHWSGTGVIMFDETIEIV